MTRLTDRRTILLAAGTAAAAVVAGTVTAQSATQINGTVEYEGGAAIPKGEVQIRLDDKGKSENARTNSAEVNIASEGDDKALTFSLALPAATAAKAQITARLEREDGWLLARGSASVADDGSVSVILYTVMY